MILKKKYYKQHLCNTKYLEYNINKAIEYYNDFKEEKYGIKKDSKRYLAKQIK